MSLHVAEKLESKGEFKITLANTGNTSVDNYVFDLGLNAAAGTAGPSLSVDESKTTGSLCTGESSEVAGTIKFSSSTNNVINYGVHSGDTMHCSGMLITTKAHFYDDDRYGTCLDEDSKSGTLWYCGSTFKVSKSREAPQNEDSGSGKKGTVTFYAAKNEYEAFQLVLKAPSSGSQEITSVAMSSLVSVDNSAEVISDVSVRRVMYLKTDHPTDNIYGRVGEYWPDPLVPLDLPYKCPAGENCPFWVLVHVPYGAKEGTYKGTVTLSTKDKEFSADVSLKVWNFTIPKKPTLKSLFGLGIKYIQMHHHVKNANETMRSLVYEKYLSFMPKHRISSGTHTSSLRLGQSSSTVSLFTTTTIS